MIKHTVFAQLTQLMYRYNFNKSVDRHNGDRCTKRFNCWQQFVVLLFAAGAGSQEPSGYSDEPQEPSSANRYHLGLQSVAKSTLADANNTRDCDMYKDIFYDLLTRCQALSPKHKFRFKNPLYIMDST